MNGRDKWGRHGLLGLTMVVGVSFAGCAGSPKEPVSQPSVEDVRGDSDRFFKKMEQEEKTQPSP